MNQRASIPLTVAAAALLAALAVTVILLLGARDEPGAQPALALSPPPNEIFEHAVAVALPSVVQIETDKGLGSGVVLDGRGDIVTNAHVVGNASRFVVTDADGKRSSGTLRGVFKAGDIAVIHSDARLRPATFGHSSALRVGQIVLAIGAPLGLQSSATQGIVSATSRTVDEGNGVALSSVIQTSAAINPGNSGGALIDLQGRVVGMPTLAAVDPEFGRSPAPGIGFAISSDSVRTVVRQIVAGGRVTHSGRPSLGVDLRSDTSGHVRVAGVTPGGPAARGGIRVGDDIETITGHSVQTVDDVIGVLATLRPQQRVPVAVATATGGHRTVAVTLGEIAGS